MVYKTSILTDDDGPGFRGTIRVYAGTHQATLEDDSIVFIYGKVYAPSDEPFLIEAVYMFAYPREVVENSLDQLMLFAPRLCILGHVCGNVETTYEGRRIFKVLSTAYVRDSLKVTSFMCVVLRVFFDSMLGLEIDDCLFLGLSLIILHDGREQQPRILIVQYS